MINLFERGIEKPPAHPPAWRFKRLVSSLASRTMEEPCRQTARACPTTPVYWDDRAYAAGDDHVWAQKFSKYRALLSVGVIKCEV